MALTRSGVWAILLGVALFAAVRSLNDSWVVWSVDALLRRDDGMAPVAYSLIVLAGFALQGCAVLAVRRHPHLGLLLAFVLFAVVGVWLNSPTWVSSGHLTLAVTMFFVAERGRHGRTFGTFCLLMVLVAVTHVLYVATFYTDPLGTRALYFVHSVVEPLPMIAAAALIGALWGVQSRRTAAAREAAEQLRRTDEQRMAREREAERDRVAQELHDVAAQHLAGLVALADTAAELARTAPETALGLLPDLRTEGRYAAASIYGSLGDLRSRAGDTPSTPDLSDTEGLVEWWRARGMTVRLERSGDPVDVPAVVSATAERVVHEALANAAKHAPGTVVDVRVDIGSHRVEVSVANARPPGGAVPTGGPGLGWGIPALRSRVALLDGDLRAGPDAGGGWRVDATLPVSPAAVEEVRG